MAETTLTVTMDADLAQRVDDYCFELGLTLSEAIETFVRDALQDKTDLELEPNEETIAALEEMERMIADPTLGKRYTDLDELKRDIREMADKDDAVD